LRVDVYEKGKNRSVSQSVVDSNEYYYCCRRRRLCPYDKKKRSRREKETDIKRNLMV